MSTELCNYHYNQFQNIVITPNRNPVPVSSPLSCSLVWWNLPLGLLHPTGRQGRRWNRVNGRKALEAGSGVSPLPSPLPWPELSPVALPERMEKCSLSGHWGRRGKFGYLRSLVSSLLQSICNLWIECINSVIPWIGKSVTWNLWRIHIHLFLYNSFHFLLILKIKIGKSLLDLFKNT